MILSDSEALNQKYTIYSNEFEFLKKIVPTLETGAIDIQKPEERNIPRDLIVCSGCELDNKCYPFGYRKDGNYCSDSQKFVTQLQSDVKCDNNFECGSNVCVSNKCINPGLIDKIIAWFKRLFGSA